MKIYQRQILSTQYEKVSILSVPGTALKSQNIPAETVNFGFNQGQGVQIGWYWWEKKYNENEMRKMKRKWKGKMLLFGASIFVWKCRWMFDVLLENLEAWTCRRKIWSQRPVTRENQFSWTAWRVQALLWHQPHPWTFQNQRLRSISVLQKMFVPWSKIYVENGEDKWKEKRMKTKNATSSY